MLDGVSILHLCEAAVLISEINIKSWNRLPISGPLGAIPLDVEPLIKDCFKCGYKHH